MSQIERSTLRPGYEISRLVKGGWQLAGDHGTVEKNRAIDDMLAFYDAGVTTFDCADIYTGVEDMLGAFRRELLNKRRQSAVETIRIHAKYVPDISSLSTLNAQHVATSIERSLKRLGCECLDLVQFHWWDYQAAGFLEALSHLQTLQKQGKIEHIGVTNFDTEHLLQMNAECDIASAQVQYSLLDRRLAGSFAGSASQYNTHLLVYGVLAGGFLTDRWLGVPDPGFEFENRSPVKYRLVIEDFGGWSLFQKLLQVLRSIADKHDVDIDTVAIRSMLDNTDVTATIVGARYAERLPQTLRVFDLKLEAGGAGTPGKWDCHVTSDEFCHFLEGRCTYVHGTCNVIEITPDTAAFFPKDWKGVCTVAETVKKVYVIR